MGKITHNKCGGIIQFDSFGNFKCQKCGLISKDKKHLKLEE